VTDGWLTENTLIGLAEHMLWTQQCKWPNQTGPVPIGPADPDRGPHWGADRTIRACLIRQLAVGRGPNPNPCSVRLQGARISGKLDLEALTLVCTLDLNGCYFDEQINLQQTHAPAIYLLDCRIPNGIRADQLFTEHNFDLSDSHIKQAVILTAAHIGGQLLMKKSRVSGRKDDDDNTLAARSMTAEQGAHFTELKCQGKIDLTGGTIGRSLKMAGAKLTTPVDGVSLLAHRVKVAGGLNLSKLEASGGEPFEAEGRVDLTGSRIRGNLRLSGGLFNNGDRKDPNEKALDLSRVVVDQNAYLDEMFTATGTVYLLDAHIRGSLNCAGGVFDNENDTAIHAAGITVDRDVKLTKMDYGPEEDRSSFLSRGAVVLSDATIGGTLDCSDGSFSYPKQADAIRQKKMTRAP
jgi:hypothetical protein